MLLPSKRPKTCKKRLLFIPQMPAEAAFGHNPQMAEKASGYTPKMSETAPGYTPFMPETAPDYTP
jgi:hypothetical protein